MSDARRPTSSCRRAVPLALAPLGALALAGCLNERTTLTHAGQDPLPDLATAPSQPASGVATTSLDRSSWPAVVLWQPRGQVEWSFFGTASPEWAVSRGPGELGAVPQPQFAPRASANDSPASTSDQAAPSAPPSAPATAPSQH